MDHPARWRAVFDLLAAHRDLSQLEWLELKRSVALAALCLIFAVLFALTGWAFANVGIVLAVRGDPLRAVVALAVFNLVAAIVAALAVRRLLGRPFFALTRREVSADARNLLRTMP